jgi:hypothetical protein
MQRSGRDFPNARALLIGNHIAELERMTQISPELSQEVEQANAAAAAATEKANQALTSRRRVVQGLETGIRQLGSLRRKAEDVRALVSAPAQAEALANRVIEAFLAHKHSQSEQTRGAVETLNRLLTETVTISPFAPKYAAAMTKQADQLEDQIRASAKQGRVSLATLLQRMRDEASATSNNSQRDPGLAELFFRGYLNFPDVTSS